jgi:HSP20 family molecular chaperone IbpA
MIAPQQEQLVPVRMYEGDGRLMVVAPMPGLEAEDISVSLRKDLLVIRGEYRGPHQAERDLLIAEWAIGPYYRDLQLPQPVDGTRTNATYGNGVLVLAMPKLVAGEDGSDAEFRLEVVQAARGERVGHAGRDLHETTTEEHRRAMERSADSAHSAHSAVHPTTDEPVRDPVNR